MPYTRREFLGTASAALAASAFAKTPSPSPSRPNVLFILTDEQSLWTLGAYGAKLPGTPNIDSIGAEGATFRNFFVTSAVCTPSRGCYMTGMYPHAHGAVHNDLPLNKNCFTIGNMFQQAGYDTGYLGKWHLDGTNDPSWPDWIPTERSFGFTDHEWMFNQGHWKRIVEHPANWPNNKSEIVRSGEFDAISAKDKKADKPDYVAPTTDGRPNLSYHVDAPGTYFTEWITDKTIDFLRRPRTAPFFCVVSIPDPHPPFAVEESYASMFPRSDMKLPETFHEKNLPQWAEKHRLADVKREHVSSEDDPRREQIFRERKAQYLGMVKCIDDNVGRILQTLKQMNLMDDTLIIFGSDHGEFMGEHGIYFKNDLYETAHHVGLVMRLPGKIHPGTNIQECVANVDFLPTLAGLLKLPTSGKEQGHDASPLLRGEKTGWKDQAFIHKDNFSQAGIFTQQWELGLARDGGSVLYDRKNDPLQINNLYSDPAHRKVVEELTVRTVEHNLQVGSPAMKWLATWKVGS